MLLIVGLGNPPKKYLRSRHNIGYRCIESIAVQNGLTISTRVPNALIASGTIESTQLTLAKPTTYMNESGVAVRSLLRSLNLAPPDLVVIYDDMDLPTGKLRIRPKGGAGGHNGIRSIIGNINSADFVRIRLGVGRPHGRLDAISHVLGDFTNEEEALVETAITRASDAIISIATDGVDKAMTRHNTDARQHN
tara:strand:+ start:3845 stop:4423 length:579 start_codon:yes stop_codon:yes gene_type:complete